MSVTFGVVGLGGRSTSAYGDVKRLDWLELKAFCDVEPKRLERLADEFGVPERYTRYGDLLDSDIDFVFIATPPELHVRMTVQALEAGKHVLCEIPAATNIEEAQLLIEATSRSGLLYMIAENYCYRRDIQAFRRSILSGEIGRIVYASGHYCHDDRDRRANWKKRGVRTWFDDYEQPRYITHALGPLLYVTQDRVTSLVADAPEDRIKVLGNESLFTAVQCKTEKGVVLQLFYGMAVAQHGTWYSFTGEKGTLESLPLAVKPLESKPRLLGEKPYRLTKTGARHEAALRDGRMVDLDPGHPFNTYRGGSHCESDLCVIGVFAEAVRDGKPPPLDVQFGLDIALPGLAAAESVRQGGVPVEVPTP